MKKSTITRVIGCQGSIQLITATNVVLRQTDENENYRTFLVVYELFTPHGQDKDFYQFLKRMAGAGPIRFENIIYIDAPLLQQIREEFERSGQLGAQQMLTRIIGVGKADELYLTSNWHLGNKILMNGIPATRTICYGDSIGIHIPEGYFDHPTLGSRLKKIPLVRYGFNCLEALSLFSKYPSRRPRLRILKPKKFHKGYYLSLELTAQKPKWPYHFTSRQTLFETFRQYTNLLSPELIDDPALQNHQLTVLMTTNFSEAGKMTIENEISGYCEYIKHHVTPNTTLVIKPHPRDSQAKLKQLKDALSSQYTLKVFDNPSDFFVPFELVLIMLGTKDPDRLKRINYHTFSSACLAIKILFNQNPAVGFGESLVQKYFEPQHRLARVQHENDLKRTLSAISRTFQGGVDPDVLPHD